ncbi:MAG: hypothetical protein WC389_00870 [Lutibacter sp.]|jgi:hypothetical protein
MEDFEEEEIDPIEYIYKLVVDAENKHLALRLTDIIAPSVEEDEIELEARIAIYHIFSSVYIWNDDYLNASKFQEIFLKNTNWCDTNYNTIEVYLAIIFAKNNKDFIDYLLINYPFIKSKFKNIYNAYLSSVLDPTNEEYFNQNLMKQYNLLLQVKRLYVD